MKVVITEIQYGRAVDHYISYFLEPHEIKTIHYFPPSIFWVKDGKTIVEIENSKHFWLRKDIWEDISKMFDLNVKEVNSIIKMWLEKHYNLGKLIVIPIEGWNE